MTCDKTISKWTQPITQLFKKRMWLMAKSRSIMKWIIFFSGTEFEHLLHFVTEASQHGIGVLDGDLRDNNWSLGQSFLFTVTVVTTVGKTI